MSTCGKIETVSQSPCTALTAGKCPPLGLCKETVSGLWGDSHWLHEPMMHCNIPRIHHRWGYPQSIFSQRWLQPIKSHVSNSPHSPTTTNHICVTVWCRLLFAPCRSKGEWEPCPAESLQLWLHMIRLSEIYRQGMGEWYCEGKTWSVKYNGSEFRDQAGVIGHLGKCWKGFEFLVCNELYWFWLKKQMSFHQNGIPCWWPEWSFRICIYYDVQTVEVYDEILKPWTLSNWPDHVLYLLQMVWVSVCPECIKIVWVMYNLIPNI